MTTRQLELASQVLKDFESIQRFYAAKNPLVGAKIIDAIDQAIGLVAENPQLYSFSHLVPTVRSKVVEPHRDYSIVYRFDDSIVLIPTIWDNRQNPAKLLSLLKTSL